MFPPLYAILDPAFLDDPITPFAVKLAAAGVRLIQLRDKWATAGSLLKQSRELVAVLAPMAARLIVNDRPDVAALADGGVHVGQDDLPVEEARRIVGAGVWVGISTHNLDQFREAAASSADYVAVGPVFATASKKNPDPVVGLELLREARRLTRKPIVAIGGITAETAEDVFAAGADSVAVISDLARHADPAARARQYLEIAARAGKF